jgi:ribosome-associated protein
MKRPAPHRGVDVHYGEADHSADAQNQRPSKSQAKRDAHALQALGVELAELSPERLAAVDMPEPLRDAIVQYQRTRSHEGRRRQMQLVGKLMHNADEAVLREAVAEATLGTARQALVLHEAERWRAEFIASDDAIGRWITEHPETDAQHLRSLVRAARRDGAGLTPEARQPKSFRELFALIRPLLSV